jgi:hypothetical protein
MKQLSGGKAPGSDALPAEIYKLGGAAAIVHRVTEFLETMKTPESFPCNGKLQV